MEARDIKRYLANARSSIEKPRSQETASDDAHRRSLHAAS